MKLLTGCYRKKVVETAERRMFAKTIVLSDAFLDMPMGARCLYMTMGMVADDDGFVNAPKSIMRQISATEDDLKVLIAKHFVIPFDSGIIVIKHWRINNYLQKDRYQETKYLEEKNMLSIGTKGDYSLKEDECIHSSVYTGKDSIGKDSIEDNISFTNVNDMSDSKIRQDIKTAVDAWNALSPLGFSKISRLLPSSERYKRLKTRISEYGIDDVIKAIDNVRNSEYLRNAPWFAFDWFVRPNNFPKVLDGNYNDKDSEKSQYQSGSNGDWQ
jgi:hypothetical protein